MENEEKKNNEGAVNKINLMGPKLKLNNTKSINNLLSSLTGSAQSIAEAINTEPKESELEEQVRNLIFCFWNISKSTLLTE